MEPSAPGALPGLARCEGSPSPSWALPPGGLLLSLPRRQAPCPGWSALFTNTFRLCGSGTLGPWQIRTISAGDSASQSQSACQLTRRRQPLRGLRNMPLANGQGLRDNLAGKGSPRTEGSLLTVWLGAVCLSACSLLGSVMLQGAGTPEAQARVPAMGHVPAGSTKPSQELGDTVLLGQN